MKLTKGAITALKTDKPDHVFWDDGLPGFGVRLRGSAKRWVIQYRVGQKQRRESLGDVRKVSLDDARAIARKRFASVELGHDPGADKAKARIAASRAVLTVGAVAQRYLDAKQETLRPNTFREATRYLLRTWQPFHDRPLDSIVRADVAAQLQIVIKANGRIAAARARSYLAALFTWSMKEGLCDVNPVVATNDPGAGARPRERVLSDLELAAIWNACEADDFGRIVRLLILSGCRRQEIGSLRWSDIDFDSGTITIPGDRTKNHRALSLPLPPVALAILQSTPHRGDHVFGSRGVGFSSWSTSTAAFRRLASPLAPWTLHDLRRTLRTGMGVLGVPPHIAELVIGHAKAGIQAVYDKHRYEPEIKRALALWANHVLAVVEGREQKVVPLRGA